MAEELTIEKKELITNSKNIIESKEEITSLENSKGGYIESIKEAFKKDNVNRIEFLKKNCIVAGLSLEFRNIYGIEPPYYDINRDKHLTIATSTGTGLNTSEKYKNDSTGEMEYAIKVPDISGNMVTTFADCQELVNASLFEKDTKDNVDKMKFADKQRFFVDAKKNSESSSFFEPFCPPGLNKWSGTFLHELICKNFDTTELSLYNLLNGSATINSKIETIYSDTVTGSLSFIKQAIANIKKFFNIKTKNDYFSCNNPIVSNTDGSGRITRHSFQYNVSDEQLEAYKESGAIAYGVDNGGVDVSPSIYYITKSSIRESCLVRYALVEKGESKKFCSGYAILTRHPDDSNAFTFNILTQEGSLYKPSTSKSYFWGRLTVTNNHPYRAFFYPAASTDANVISAILKYYKSMLEEVIYYYDYYIQEVKGGCKIDIVNSYKSMKKIVKRINEYNNASSLNKAQKLALVKSAIKSRLESVVYNGTVANPQLPSKRAKEIDDYLRNSPDFFNNLFFAVSQRIDKRSGTMREVYRMLTNSALAFSAADSKKERLLNSLATLNAFSIESGFGTKKISVQLEPWETPASFLNSIGIRSVIKIVCDNNVSVLGAASPIITAVITDVEHIIFKKEEISVDEYGDETRTVTQKDTYQLTLSKKVPEVYKELNPRIVKTTVGIATLKNKLKGYID